MYKYKDLNCKDTVRHNLQNKNKTACKTSLVIYYRCLQYQKQQVKQVGLHNMSSLLFFDICNHHSPQRYLINFSTWYITKIQSSLAHSTSCTKQSMRQLNRALYFSNPMCLALGMLSIIKPRDMLKGYLEPWFNLVRNVRSLFITVQSCLPGSCSLPVQLTIHTKLLLAPLLFSCFPHLNTVFVILYHMKILTNSYHTRTWYF